jgi:hypothetical protein
MWPPFAIAGYYSLPTRLQTALPSRSRSKSKFCYERRTVAQTVLVSRPIWVLKPVLLLSVAVCWCVTSSMRRGRVWRLLLLLTSAVILGAESRGTHDHILLSQIRDCSHLEGQVPVFISTRKRAAELFPQTLVSFFVTSYDSWGYGESIRTR